MSKQFVFDKVNELEALCTETCRYLWDNPEVGGTEVKSAAHLREILSKEGFVIVNEEKMEHAFYAEYGSGHPVIGFLGEFDALPGLSQKCSPVREAVEEGAPGHGCGHNLLGTASMTAAIAVKRLLEKEKLSGTVRFYGCPEEELLSGKVKMAYYGMFKGCDIALTWHPGTDNTIIDSGELACAYEKFYFSGITSHAAFAPELGRSAMDAVELMNVGSNYLREHVISSARIHYSSDNCGFPPNIVPSKAVAWYAVRAPHMADVQSILHRIENIAKGAALMTDTEVEMKIQHGCCEIRPNHKLSDLTWQNMCEAEMPVYTEEELAYAKSVQDTLKPEAVARSRAPFGTTEVLHSSVSPRDKWKEIPMTASTDAGDVSYIMPMCFFTVANLPFGVAPHTWQATAMTGTSIGAKNALYAARIMAGTAYDLLTQPETTAAIIKEYKDANVEYSPMYSE
ncbi:MAG: amidohydrolase [Oscillospiraceae bacterium]|nr:amidohydrolase [Oscillospiraceae bacterium]